jgi:hypothetical protein
LQKHGLDLSSEPAAKVPAHATAIDLLTDLMIWLKKVSGQVDVVDSGCCGMPGIRLRIRALRRLPPNGGKTPSSPSGRRGDVIVAPGLPAGIDP